MKETLTSNSNRKWLYRHKLMVERYLRRFHKREDQETAFELLFWKYPDEGKKLIKNFNLTNEDKINMFLDWIIKNPTIICGIFGDQRQGKDATICYFLDRIKYRCEILDQSTPRIVTLGNIRNPPFVKKTDMYFSFLNIPSGSIKQDVFIYTSEMDTQLPSREVSGKENKLFAQLSGTFAQNHQKLFGCLKLASKVDINFIRDMNTKIFKFITPEKLIINGVERDNVITGLGKLLLPKEMEKKEEVLLVFNNNLLNVSIPLPNWWSLEYSEMFREIPNEKVKEYVLVQFSNGLTLTDIQTAVRQKFRKSLNKQQLCQMLEISHDNIRIKY